MITSTYKYFRMTPARFDSLLSLVGPAILWQTKISISCTPGEKVAVTIILHSFPTLLSNINSMNLTICTWYVC